MGWIEQKIKNINERKSATINPAHFPDETFELFSVPIFPTGNAELLQGKEIGSTKQLVEAGDVLLCKINPRINRVWVVTEPKGFRQIASSEWIVISSSVHDSDFLKYYFRENKFRGLLCSDVSGVGGSLTRAKPKLVNEYNVIVAPLAEQTRIVEKLDEVLAQVDTIKARLDGIPAILKRFRQSVLAAAVSGKLTEEWHNQKSFNQWGELKLSEVTSHVVDCPHSTPKWSDEGRYCVRTTAFNPFYLDLSEQGYVDDEVFTQRTSRLVPEAGDILYSREGTVGIACQIPEGVELCLGQRMVVIRANDKVDAKFLTIVLNSEHILKIVRELTIGSTAPRVNMKVIRDYPVPVPDLVEQKEIVRLVDQYFAFADTIDAQVKKAQARVDKLTQSILAKAFRGELVPQDPSDEPADKLLERIALARKEAEVLAKAAKKTAKK
ncbi:restriction endonuclease subunit S [Vibrio cholerae]|nr:restriction endonuclease subunit S [Vibrio cholerae]